MPALARHHVTHPFTRAANDDCINGGSCTRTKYSYDANGNAITRQGATISWSSYNYPTTINAGSGSTAETVSLSYGPDRGRWQQSYVGNSTQETTDYVGGLMEVVSSGGVTDYRHYINAGGEQIAVYSRKSSGTNTFSYLLSDHQASVASITNGSGGVVVGESFTAFGSRRNPTTWSGAASNSDLTTAAGITREGYTFQTQLGLWMGMNHMNGRVEDSITGRMLSADPHIPDKSNSQSYNRYTYVNNNPVTYGDPSGFTPCGSKCQRPNPICATAWVQCDGPYNPSPANSPAGLGEGGVDWGAVGAGAGVGAYGGLSNGANYNLITSLAAADTQLFAALDTAVGQTVAATQATISTDAMVGSGAAGVSAGELANVAGPAASPVASNAMNLSVPSVDGMLNALGFSLGGQGSQLANSPQAGGIPGGQPNNFAGAALAYVGTLATGGGATGFLYGLSEVSSLAQGAITVGGAVDFVGIAAAASEPAAMAIVGTAIGGAAGVVTLPAFGLGYAIGTVIEPHVEPYILDPICNATHSC